MPWRLESVLTSWFSFAAHCTEQKPTLLYVLGVGWVRRDRVFCWAKMLLLL